MFLHFLRSISIPFGILAYLAQGLQSTYCPVSQQSNFSDFLYPVDIYDCKNGNHQASDFETNNCFSFREKERSDPFINKHNCSFTYKIKCPVDQSLLVNALKRTKAITAYSPICHLKNRLADPNQQINIYILGGSVTAGANTNGCCPTPECVCQGAHHCYRCALPHYIGEYLKATNRATVNVFNGGGIRGKPKEFSSSFRNYISSIDSSFKGFTSNDVVFLDFSANEAFSGSHFRDKAILRDFQTGAESLIRKVYRHSTPHSFPTVIYLATAPIPYQDTELRGANEHFDHWYLELARHYNATVWSYRDAILAAIADRDTVGKSVSAKASDQCNSLGDRVDALDYLDYRHYGDTIHPSWHVHMFQSDLYASIWEHELNACNDPHIHTLVPNQDKKLSSTDNIAINLAVSNRTYAALPTELYDMSGATNEVFCDTYLQSDPLLYLSYAAIMKKEHHHSHHHTHLKPLAGSYESDPPNSWKLAEDVVGRGGFITSTIGAKIKFKFANLTYAAFQKVSAMYSVVINIEYLKTYENIGTVHVNICGRPIQQINGLWDDYQDNRVSYVQLFELDFNHEQCRVNTDSLIEVELTFKPNAPESITKGHQAHFKVISVMACFYRPDATSPF